MDGSPFLPLPDGLMIELVTETDTDLTILVQATAPVAKCPRCHVQACHIHSHYQRRVADLPSGGRQVALRLAVRRFFCLNLACSQVIFSERLAPLVEPWARKTTRLIAALRAVALATGGEAGTRLAPQVGMQASPSTILRQIKATPLRLPAPLTKVGLDDFALRRGLRYGTIIVDLDTHRVVDVLPDRSAATATAWLQVRPQIELISRDRGTEYITAAREGAPQARQVADRWHLLRNLSEAVVEVLTRHQAEMRRASRSLVTPPTLEPEAEAQAPQEAALSAGEEPLPLLIGRPYREPRVLQAELARRVARYDCYEQVVALREHRLTAAEIAQRVGRSARTVRRWLSHGSFPEQRQRRKRPSLIDPYEAYLLRRWQAGCHNGLQLWREIAAQGYAGSQRAFYHYLGRLRDPAPPPPPPKKRQATTPKRAPPPPGPYDHLSLKKVAWWWLRPQGELTQADQEAVDFVRQVHPQLEISYQLTRAFVGLMQARQAEALDPWIEQARFSRIPELVRFGLGLKRDYDAVLASLQLPYSQGVVEGHVNRLKLIKRLMYGRASFPLLRTRVLHHAS